MDNANDFLEILFGSDAVAGPSVVETTAAELAASAAEKAARDAEKVANRCPKCTGSGFLSQFMHRKGGECFTCGGSGVFARYH